MAFSRPHTKSSIPQKNCGKLAVIVAVTYAGSFDIDKSCSLVDVAQINKVVISHRECSFVNVRSTRSFTNTRHAFISEHSEHAFINEHLVCVRTRRSKNLIVPLIRRCPYLARFSRDVGYHGCRSTFLGSQGIANRGPWSPTSREKRARYGAPPDSWSGQKLTGRVSRRL